MTEGLFPSLKLFSRHKEILRSISKEEEIIRILMNKFHRDLFKVTYTYVYCFLTFCQNFFILYYFLLVNILFDLKRKNHMIQFIYFHFSYVQNPSFSDYPSFQTIDFSPDFSHSMTRRSCSFFGSRRYYLCFCRP